MPRMGLSSKGLGFTGNELVATGGLSYYPGDGYKGVYFTSNGTFTILNGIRDIEVLVISGGSGGGGGANLGTYAQCGGGGGAGANYTSTTINNAPLGAYTITVGAGGAGGTRMNAPSTNGHGGGQGGTGGTSSIVKSGITTISNAGPVGGTGGFVFYDIQYFVGGNGASNALYSGASGYPNRYGGGGGGAGAGSFGVSSNPYYEGGVPGTFASVAGMNTGFGYGGYGGAYYGRYGSYDSLGSGGAGGGGANDATYQPGYTGYFGGVYLRWRA